MPTGFPLTDLAQDAMRRAGRWAHTHHRGLATSLLILLAGFGVTAFGIAPLAPDVAALPQRLLTESVTPDDLGAQLEALAVLRLQLDRKSTRLNSSHSQQSRMPSSA